MDTALGGSRRRGVPLRLAVVGITALVAACAGR